MNHRRLVVHGAALLFAQALSAQVFATPASAVLTGIVTDAQGRAVEHADVSIQDANGKAVAHASTGRDGRFTLEGVEAGTYAATVAAKGFGVATSIATVESGQSHPLEVVLEKDATLDVTVNAQRLDRARNGLLPEVGSSVYRITQADINALPQGENTPLNQVLLQAPGVANDSYGQVHVRGDHADLQYRINGIVIPEPITGFGQSFDTRIIDQVNLVTGALPAQYGYRTAGIVDIRTMFTPTEN
jgi:hypothetical protein